MGVGEVELFSVQETCEGPVPLNEKAPPSHSPAKPRGEEHQFDVSDAVAGGPAVPEVVSFERVFPFL